MTSLSTSDGLKVSDLHGMTLEIKLERGLSFGSGQLKETTFAYVYECRHNPAGKKLKSRPLWGPIGIPGRPDASYADLLRALADALDANPPS